MDINVLKQLVTIVAEGSFSKAAQKLFISQQGLNRSITGLEKEVGCALISRTQRGVQLTNQGRTFLEHTHKILFEYEHMLADLDAETCALDFLQSYQAKLTTTPVCMLYIIAPLLEKGLLQNVMVRELTTQQAFASMEGCGWLYLVDLFSALYPKGSLESEYCVTPIIETQVGIITRKSICPDIPKVISAKQASSLPLGIYNNDTTRAMYETIFARYPLTNVVMSLSSINSALAGMYAGRFALLADSFAWLRISAEQKKGPDGIVFSAFEGNYHSTYAFVYKKENPPRQEDRHYLNVLAKRYDALVQDSSR